MCIFGESLKKRRRNAAPAATYTQTLKCKHTNLGRKEEKYACGYWQLERCTQNLHQIAMSYLLCDFRQVAIGVQLTSRTFFIF